MVHRTDLREAVGSCPSEYKTMCGMQEKAACQSIGTKRTTSLSAVWEIDLQQTRMRSMQNRRKREEIAVLDAEKHKNKSMM